MSRINTGRVVLGGLVAGVVANAVDYVTQTYLMADEMNEMARRLNLNSAAASSSMITWIVVDFVWGFLLVFAYAAMRPRFEPGPKTAAIAAATLWLAATIMFMGLTSMGIFTQGAFMKGAALTLGSSLIASLAGAWVYKEDGV